jgi:UDP:flavonoid glycosyltransferase YjiC (YdhE family)
MRSTVARGVRVLITSTGGAGHFGPLLPFLEALERRGDDVLIVVPPELEATVAPMGRPFVLGADPPADEANAIWESLPRVSLSEAAILGNREFFGRLCTTAMLPAVERACREWRPDLVLHEAAEFASAVAAERRGIAHAQVAISLADVEASSLVLAEPVLEEFHEGLAERLRRSPYLTRFPAALDPSPYSATRRFRERPPERSGALPDWWRGSTVPLIYVTFGSVAGQFATAKSAYSAALAAVDGLDARVLVTVGHATDIDALIAPANVHIEAWIPQDDVLRDAALVVAHGGSGTTFGALAAGVPLVLVPLFADQPVNADRVAAAGAGLVVEQDERRTTGVRTIGTEDAPRLRAAIETILNESSYTRAARMIAEQMHACPLIDDLVAALAAEVRIPPTPS